MRNKWDSSEEWLNNDHYSIHSIRFSPKQEPRLRCYFFHGTGNDAFYPNLDLFDALLSHGFEVYSFDLPGHGKNSKGPFDSLLLDSYLEVLQEKISEIQSQENLNFFFLGYSLGCYFAENLAHKFKSTSMNIAPPHGLNLVRPMLPLKEGIGFFKAYQKTSFYDFKSLIPAVIWLGRKKFPVRTSGQSMISTVKKICENTQYSDNSFRFYGKYDEISPVPLEIKKNDFVYPTAHFDLIFDRKMFEDIIRSAGE